MEILSLALQEQILDEAQANFLLNDAVKDRLHQLVDAKVSLTPIQAQKVPHYKD